MVVGVTAGFATLELPNLGWLLVGAFVIVSLASRHRLWAISGLLTGLGAIWLILLGRVALSCRAPDGEIGCQAPGIEVWLAVGATILASGIVLGIWSWRRQRPPW